MAQQFRLVKYYNLPRYTHMRTMVLVYLPTKLGDFGQGQMLGFIFRYMEHMGYNIDV